MEGVDEVVTVHVQRLRGRLCRPVDSLIECHLKRRRGERRMIEARGTTGLRGEEQTVQVVATSRTSEPMPQEPSSQGQGRISEKPAMTTATLHSSSFGLSLPSRMTAKARRRVISHRQLRAGPRYWRRCRSAGGSRVEGCFANVRSGRASAETMRENGFKTSILQRLWDEWRNGDMEGKERLVKTQQEGNGAQNEQSAYLRAVVQQTSH